MQTEFTTLTLADQVEAKIISYIEDRGLKPGDTLPTEFELVNTFGVSRNVVREAMSRLRMLGLIQTRPKRGIIITEPPLLNGLKKVFNPNLFKLQTIKEMMGLRIALEVGISDFIFNNRTEKLIEELEQIVAQQKNISIDMLSVEDEMRFHTKIYEMAGNQFIIQLNEIIQPIFVFARQNYQSNFAPVNNQLRDSNEIITHEDLLCLIRENRKNDYREAIRTHLIPYWEFISNKTV
ncbi:MULTISPECIES: FadR/GntR family transcriptional regulator [unclassified Carboxylicivirga]|uniref:FadR/GntR family transcriptional regulator n=1 Tax=Carboxylicivirga TaxID=1628153 RepID=UPI003D351528